MATLAAELELGWIGRIAFGATLFQFRPALPAKIHRFGVFKLTFGALHFRELPLE